MKLVFSLHLSCHSSLAPICVFLIFILSLRAELARAKRQNIFSFPPPFPLALNIPFSPPPSPVSSLVLFSFSFHTLVPLFYCPPQFPRPVWVSRTKKTRSDNEKKAHHEHTKITPNERKEDRRRHRKKREQGGINKKRLGERMKWQWRGRVTLSTHLPGQLKKRRKRRRIRVETNERIAPSFIFFLLFVFCFFNNSEKQTEEIECPCFIGNVSEKTRTVQTWLEFHLLRF